MDGYISKMSVSIPWSSILSDSSFVEVVGLMLTIQPKQRADSGKFVCPENFDVFIGKLSCFIIIIFESLSTVVHTSILEI